jgi:hypothetical protein
MTAKRQEPPQDITIDPASNGFWTDIAIAAEGGAFRLPDGALEFVRAVALANREARIAAMQRRPSGWKQAVIEIEASGLTTSPTLGTIQQAVEKVMAQEAAAAAAEIRYSLTQALVEKLAQRDVVAFHESTILPALQEALAEVFAEVRKLPAGVPTTMAEAFNGPSASQDAYRRLQVLQARYQALNGAWAALRTAPGTRPSLDQNGLFADTPVMPETSPSPTIAIGSHRPAGPQGPGRILWLAQPGNGWLPSLEEQDALYAKWLGPVPKGMSIDEGTIDESAYFVQKDSSGRVVGFAKA